MHEYVVKLRKAERQMEAPAQRMPEQMPPPQQAEVAPPQFSDENLAQNRGMGAGVRATETRGQIQPGLQARRRKPQGAGVR